MILIIYNYDSFTYNIIQQAGPLVDKLEVAKNNKISIRKIKCKNYSHIIISPGPGGPKDAGESINIIRNFYKKIPILGICLGHQAIGEAFNCNVKKHASVFHGKVSSIYQEGASRIYKGLPNKFKATRYHSLVIDKKNNFQDFVVNACLNDGTIMGIEHKKYPLYGVQFHPESIETQYGDKIIKNFIKIV